MWFSNDFCYEKATFNISDLEHYLRFRRMCTFYLSWILPLIIIVGIVGSVFCLIFLLFSKLFPKNLLLWLISICVADLMILLFDGLWMLLKMWFGYDIRDLNDIVCFSHLFLSNYFFYWSAYMQMMVSIQRAYLIMRPLKARTSLAMPKLISVWTLLSILLISPHIIYVVKWRVKNGDCDPADSSNFTVTTVFDLIIWGIIPFVTMVVSTCIISINVCVFQARSVHLPLKIPKAVYNFVDNQKPFIVNNENHSITSTYSHSSKGGENIKLSDKFPSEMLSKNFSSSGRRHGGVDTAKHVTQLLIGMNLWYMLTTFPLLIFLIYLNFVDPNINTWRRRLFYYLLRSFSFYNACSNWIFYCAAGKLFRTTAKQIIIKMVCFKCTSSPLTLNSRASVGGGPNKLAVNFRKQ